ncbi:MAG: DUF2249 domain-containing protein [Melioribacteraceae bacterium]
MQNTENNLVTLDVRPIIEGGNDPFNEIMAAIKVLNNNQTLEVINTFEPIPLINKLKGMGYTSNVERKNDVVHTYFKKELSDAVKEKKESIYKSDPVEFVKTLSSFGDKVKTIDVRHLEMPEPMVTILKEIETLDASTVLFVEHKKIPQFLLPELEERNYSIVAKEIDANHTQLLIFKA